MIPRSQAGAPAWGAGRNLSLVVGLATILSCSGPAADGQVHSEPEFVAEGEYEHLPAPKLSHLRSWGDGDTFGSITGAALINDDRLVVLDAMNHRVQLMSGDGTLLDQEGRRGAGPREFFVPVALALTPSGEVLVLDQGNLRVTAFEVHGDSLLRTRDFRTPGPAADLCILGNRLFLLGMFENHLLHELESDGELVRSFGVPPEDPLDAALMAMGKLACSDELGLLAIGARSTPQVRVFSSAGELLQVDSVARYQAMIYDRTGGAYRPQRPAGGDAHETAALLWLPDSTLMTQLTPLGKGEVSPVESRRLIRGEWIDGPLWPRFVSWAGPGSALMIDPGLAPTLGEYRVE